MAAIPSQDVLIALRRIIQAVDVHSRRLMQTVGLTMPQIIVLHVMASGHGAMTAGELAIGAGLTQGTLSPILDRLERKQLVQRVRARDDRRKVLVSLTPAGHAVLAQTPPLLQQHFVEAFARLQSWEQTLILSSLQRVADLMHTPAPEITAGFLDAALEPAPGNTEAI